MKKTLLVTLDFYPSVGGIANYWKHLGSCMSHDTWVVLAPPLPHGVKEIDAPYTIYREPFFSGKNCHSRFRKFSYFSLITQIWKIAKKEHIKKIIVGQVLPVGTVVWIVSKLLRIPYCVSVHGMDVGLAKRHRRKRMICKKILFDAECVIANSAYTGSLIREYDIPEEKIIYVFPCPSVTPKLLSSCVIPSDPPTGGENPDDMGVRSKKIVLSVGRLVARKGFEYLIHALPEVLEKEPDAVCIILGDGPMASQLEGLVHELQLEKCVFFIKNASDTELAAWYDVCTVCVMTPYEDNGDVEGFGIVYLDANGFGKPVIGTRSGGVPEAVIDGKTGLLVTPKNSAEIAQAVARLLSDMEYANRLGRQGRERVSKEFQWSVQAEKLEKMLS
ncbi:glycosyltransferase [Candidatus Uhrbacteria bacterium]|nr:glycosyltransferase [Candidatus Uhrbacteria bacterium]